MNKCSYCLNDIADAVEPMYLISTKEARVICPDCLIESFDANLHYKHILKEIEENRASFCKCSDKIKRSKIKPGESK